MGILARQINRMRCVIGGGCRYGGVCGPQIANMLFGFGVFVLAIGSAQCVVRRYKMVNLHSLPPRFVEMPVDLQPAASNSMKQQNWPSETFLIKRNPLDLQPETSNVVWNLQPQETDLQPAASNVIEVNQLDTQSQPISSSFSVLETSGNSASGRRGSARRSKSLLSTDDDDGKSAKQKAAKEKPKAQLQQAKTAKAKTLPKSINEVIEGKPAQVAVSSKSFTKPSNDLKKSGSYVSGSLGDGFEEGYDKEKHFDKEGGKKYQEAHQSEAGKKAQQGYKKEEGFDKAADQKHGKEEKKVVISEKQDEKKGHVEQEEQFGKEFKGNHGEKGISVTKKGGHKKGSKKKGFHKVHHKDEYKKDEVFYDESHGGDEFEEHAHEQEKHAKEKGGTAKKMLLDSQYHEGHGQQEGVQDKGHSFQEASGHKKEAGEEAHSNKKSEYDKNEGVKEGQEYGHAEGGASGGGYADHDFFWPANCYDLIFLKLESSGCLLKNIARCSLDFQKVSRPMLEKVKIIMHKGLCGTVVYKNVQLLFRRSYY